MMDEKEGFVSHATLLHLIHEHLGGLESRDLVGGNGDGHVLANVTASLFGSDLDDEAAEASQIYVFAFSH